MTLLQGFRPVPNVVRAARASLALWAAATCLGADAVKTPEIDLSQTRPTTDSMPGDRERFTDLFRPAQTNQASLSPDGRHLAYTLREGEQIAVIVVAADALDTALAKVVVADDRTSSPNFGPFREKVPATVRWMKWVGNDQLAIETNGQTAIDATNSVPGIIFGFAPERRDARILLTARNTRELVHETTSPTSVTREQSTIQPTLDDPFFEEGGTLAALAAVQSDPFATVGGDPFATAGSLFTSAPLLGLLADRESAAVDPERGVGSRAVAPSVFDLNPRKPDGILVRTLSSRFLTYFELDMPSGKARQVESYTLLPERTYLPDRQGVPRFTAPGSTRHPFPHRLAFERGPRGSAGRTLAAMAGLPEEAFDISPENYFRHRALPIGFDENPDILYFASNIGRDTFGIYSVNLATGTRTDFSVEHPTIDMIPRPLDAFLPPGTLVFDRHTRGLKGVRFTDRRFSTQWLDPTLRDTQAQLEKSLPGHSVELLEWDAARGKFLVFANSATTPGRFLLFNRGTQRLAEFAQQAPWLSALPANRAFAVMIATPDGHEVPCQVTLPRTPRVMPAPIVVLCPSQPWDRIRPDFQPEVQALARMGFAVVQVTPRGAWGYGVRARESIHAGYDTAQVNDLVAVIDELGKVFNLETRRVGLVGAGWGGHVALRALAMHPGRFRCGVAIEPLIDLQGWLKHEHWTSRDTSLQLTRAYLGSEEHLKARPLQTESDRITKPALIFAYRGADGAPRRQLYAEASGFARSIRDTSPETRFKDLSHDFAGGLPGAKSAVYREIELFLNANVYDFSVEIGETVTIE